jgi:hypothetical protein
MIRPLSFSRVIAGLEPAIHDGIPILLPLHGLPGLAASRRPGDDDERPDFP